jgi:hypothetical protein
VESYAERRQGPLDVWYDRVDVAAVLKIARQERAKDLQRQLRQQQTG